MMLMLHSESPVDKRLGHDMFMLLCDIDLFCALNAKDALKSMTITVLALPQGHIFQKNTVFVHIVLSLR